MAGPLLSTASNMEDFWGGDFNFPYTLVTFIFDEFLYDTFSYYSYLYFQ